MTGSKRCKFCKLEKPLLEFCKDSSRARGFSTECRECAKARGKVYYENNRHLWKKRHIERTYDLSFEEFEKMVEIQESLCKICECEKSLVVDHDHATGKIRGLICRDCNLGLGNFNDSSYNLRSAIEYLEGKR